MKYALFSLSTMFKESPLFCIFHILNTLLAASKVYVMAYINKLLINSLITYVSTSDVSKGLKVLFYIIFLIFVIEILYSVLSHLFKYYMNKSSLKYSDNMNKKFLKKLENLDVSIYDSASTKNEMLQAKKDMQAIEAMFLNIVAIVIAIFSTIVSFSIVFKLDYLLCLGVLISLIPSFFSRKKINKELYEQEKELNLTGRKIKYFSGLFWGRSSAQDMRLFNYSSQIFSLLDELYEYKNAKKLHLTKKITFLELASLVLSGMLNMAYNIYIVYIVLSTGLTVGDYSYYSTISGNFKGNIDIVFKNLSSYLINTEKVKNYCDFMNRIPLVEDVGTNIPDTSDFLIEFSNVTFIYPESKEKVIDNLSFTVHSGEKIALAGLNGAGKTTIIKLLLRFYEPTKGTIYFNGKDIKSFKLAEYRSLFSAVFQNCVNYSLSVKQNITISDPQKSTSLTEINELLSYVGLQDVIQDVDVQVNKDFDSNGIILSMGQSQELCIARAMYKNSPILIFDEPAASLDASIEQQLFSKIFSSNNSNKTIFIISHRLSNLKNVDKIIFIEKGKCVEVGTHEELYNTNGKYQKLYKTQADRY